MYDPSTELAWEYTADSAVRTSGPFGERPAINPSGTRIAYLPVRTRAVDLVERERVRVAEIGTGEVLAALDGPATVRTLHWVRDDLLLVVRDAKRGMWLGLYEVPPGELVAEGSIGGASERRYEVTQTPDARLLCLWRDGYDPFAGDGLTWLLDGTTLAVLRNTAEDPGRVSLHPDGPRLLRAWQDATPERRFCARAAVDPPCGPNWQVTVGNGEYVDVVGARWSGRDLATVLLKSSADFDEDNDWDFAGPWRVHWYEVDVTQGVALAGGDLGDDEFDAAALSPDASRLATFRRGVGDDARGPEALLELRVLGEATPYARCGGTAQGSLERPTSVHMAWSADGEHAVALLRTNTASLLVGASAGRAMGALEYPVEPPWSWSSGLSLHGGWIVEWLYEHRVRLIDRAALR